MHMESSIVVKGSVTSLFNIRKGEGLMIQPGSVALCGLVR